MKLTDETIAHVSALAKLTLSPDEKIQVKQDLEQILGYVATIEELNTDDVLATTHVLPGSNVFREDETLPSVNRELLLANAPDKKNGCFKVPRTVE